MKTILTPTAPKPAGAYSQAIQHNNLIFVSGQLPIDPITGQKCSGPITEQTEWALRNLEAVLLAAGSDLAHVMKITLYVADLAQWSEINATYAEFFGESKPARSLVPIQPLPAGMLVEIDAIACLPED